MENRLKKQLALIKSRAITIARRGASVSEAPAAAPASDSSGHGTAGEKSPPNSDNPIIGDLIRAGAVTRASDLEPDRFDISRRLRRGPWWWRRRLGRPQADPIARAARASAFESEFQRLFAGLANGESLSIESAVPGEARALEGSSYYLVRSRGPEIDPIAPAEAGRFATLGSWPETVSRSMVGRFIRKGYAAHGFEDPRPDFATTIPLFRRADPHSILFLDIETAGLSANTYVFLCGLMRFDPETGTFEVEQAFARDYAEEEGLLLHVRSALERFDTVVTYNGASFDMPFLRTRMAVHRIPDIVPMGSVDLLHATRRVFRPALPNVRLVTVEEHLRGTARVDDIPSRFIPRAYHEYVRTQDARIMRNVVYHNRMDLFTMAVILNRLAAEGAPRAGDPASPPAGAEKPFASASAGDTIASPNPPHVPF
ncbi:MAG TPA: ribonuclease H-like domain-containing protein [Candidatus Krumholzibacteria bacterium]|nr:ribonuclease H-like domain-containing protein [Candidatus Krumholzibacteria bacterium]